MIHLPSHIKESLEGWNGRTANPMVKPSTMPRTDSTTRSLDLKNLRTAEQEHFASGFLISSWFSWSAVTGMMITSDISSNGTSDDLLVVRRGVREVLEQRTVNVVG